MHRAKLNKCLGRHAVQSVVRGGSQIKEHASWSFTSASLLRPFAALSPSATARLGIPNRKRCRNEDLKRRLPPKIASTLRARGMACHAAAARTECHPIASRSKLHIPLRRGCHGDPRDSGYDQTPTTAAYDRHHDNQTVTSIMAHTTRFVPVTMATTLQRRRPSSAKTLP